RLMAGLDVTGGDIARMGVGGLLMEIGTRPQPRDASASGGRVHAIVLAAGRSSRMGRANKLMASFAGEPLVHRVAARTLASAAASTTVILGHQAPRVAEALADLDVRLITNPD